MLKYRETNLARAGFIGAVLLMLIVAVGLAPSRLVALATAVHYQAVFAEAGGIAAGNDVRISGVKVGSVSEVSLDDGDAVVTFVVDAKGLLGQDSTAHIRAGSLLGARMLTLEPAGRGRMRPTDVIPMSRTASPYSLTKAVADLTTNSAATSTATLNQSLDTL